MNQDRIIERKSVTKEHGLEITIYGDGTITVLRHAPGQPLNLYQTPPMDPDDLKTLRDAITDYLATL